MKCKSTKPNGKTTAKIKLEMEYIYRWPSQFCLAADSTHQWGMLYLCRNRKKSMDRDYKKIFTGNFLVVQNIVEKLREIGIHAIIKDETESARLAGFASTIQGEQELYVNHDEWVRAMAVVKSVL